jgi:RNA polymerase sigma factor (sigma-70 family)
MLSRDAEGLLRELAPQVLGTLVRRWGDLGRCEDAVQEALVAAVAAWQEGMPDDPRRWLTRVARNRLVDAYRSDIARRRREDLVAAEPPPVNVPDADDTLVLLLLCCAPCLPPASAVALTLRAVGGLTTAEIAAAYLVPEATMAQRISRTKQRLRDQAEPFAMPPPDQIPDRLRLVLHVLYLIFNEGYTSSAGERLHRVELSTEAIRLTRLVHRLRPQDGAVTGLLALLLLTDARRVARTGPGGELVPLAEQDRRLWDRAAVSEGLALADRALRTPPVGEYQLQAGIAAVHARARSVEETDWPAVLALYEALERLSGNPVVTLNKAVAVAMLDGPAAALRLLEPLDAPLGSSHRLESVRAHFQEMAGDLDAAADGYARAASRATNAVERNHLTLRAARLRSGSTSSAPLTAPSVS